MLLTRSPLEYPASRAFPFDLHVLSTPPAFVLSQDQTLHKKISEQQHPKTKAVKSPNLTKNKPPQTTQKSRPMLALKKLLQRKNKQPPPTRRGTKRRGTKVEHNHMPTNPSMQPKHQTVFKKMRIPTPHRHTPTNKPQGSPANRPINTQPCTQKQKISTLAHY